MQLAWGARHDAMPDQRSRPGLHLDLLTGLARRLGAGQRGPPPPWRLLSRAVAAETGLGGEVADPLAQPDTAIVTVRPGGRIRSDQIGSDRQDVVVG